MEANTLEAVPNRRTHAHQAMVAAIETRAKVALDQYSPICIYELCRSLGVRVRFCDINMEGMYQRSTPPRIFLSSLRPLPRRIFNCAHELGHHVFKHGSTIDELQDCAGASGILDHREIMADTFAGFVLMPTIGLRHAFATRNCTPETATALQIFKIACEFGVGYATLVTHLSAGVKLLSRTCAASLLRVQPKAIRAQVLGAVVPEPLVIVDRCSVARTLDVETGMLLLLPRGSVLQGDGLAHHVDLPSGRLFRALRPGITQATTRDGTWSTFIRVAPEAYVGLAEYRHLSDHPNGSE